MGLVALLLAKSVVAAGSATPLPWYTFDDYPMKAFSREWQGATTMSVLVAPDGKPADCTVLKSSGFGELDKQTCWVAMKRVRFSPARGPDGSPVYGIYRSQVVWSRPDRDFVQHEPGPDLEVTVQALPDGTRDPAAVKIAYYVDAQGNASSCTPLSESAGQPQALVQAACTAALGRLAKAPVAAGGTAVPTVRTAAVLFTTGK